MVPTAAAAAGAEAGVALAVLAVLEEEDAGWRAGGEVVVLELGDAAGPLTVERVASVREASAGGIETEAEVVVEIDVDTMVRVTVEVVVLVVVELIAMVEAAGWLVEGVGITLVVIVAAGATLAAVGDAAGSEGSVAYSATAANAEDTAAPVKTEMISQLAGTSAFGVVA